MNSAEAVRNCAFRLSSGILVGLSDEERARYSNLLGYLELRLKYDQNPPHIIVITEMARDYDDLAAMVMVKELHRLGLGNLEGYVANTRKSTVPKAIKRAHEVFDMPSFMKDDEAIPKPEYEPTHTALMNFLHQKIAPILARDDSVGRDISQFLYQRIAAILAPDDSVGSDTSQSLYQQFAPIMALDDSVGSDTSQFLPGGESSGVLQEKATEAETSRSRRHRRGRGPHQVIGLNGSDDPEDPDFFTRDIEFRSPSGTPNLACCRLDSQCEVPLLVSSHWARENDKLSQVSRDFKDPGMMSVSGHEIKVDGVLRNMVFNLRGSTVTYRRDVFVCGDLDGWADMVAGAKFVAEQFVVLFSKAKKMFAGIFSWKKEKKGEKVQRQRLQQEADLEFEESERIRLERKAKEQREKEEARRRKHEAEAQMGQNGQVAGRA